MHHLYTFSALTIRLYTDSCLVSPLPKMYMVEKKSN